MHPVFFVTEGSFDDEVLKKILSVVKKNSDFRIIPNKNGKSGFFSDWKKFTNLGKNCHTLLLIDLDESHECVSGYLQELCENKYLPSSRPYADKLELCIAVREIETWLVADRKNFSKWSGVSEAILKKHIPSDELQFHNPKESIMELVFKYGKGDTQRSLCKNKNGNFINVQEWNMSLKDFVMSSWNPENAQKYSKSLQRLFRKISQLLISP